MELGGADAFVVLDDADIDKPAAWGVFGRQWNAGQVCVSSKRMIIDAKVYDEYLEKYTAGVAALKAGDPMDAETQLAPLSSQRAKENLLKQIEEADAIRIANDSPFGLGGSVFTSDNERGRRVAGEISTGMIFVNHPTMVKADLPFGGIRRSGYGRELIDLGLKEFVNIKLIDVVDIDAPF